MMKLYESLNSELGLDTYGKSLIHKNGKPVKYFNVINDFDKLQYIDVSSIEEKEYIERFFLYNKDVYIIPLELPDNYIFAFQLKAKNNKNFLNVRFNYNSPLVFGLSDFKNFNFNDIIVLVEGIKDVMTLKLLYPYCLAYLTSQPSNKLWDYLNQITTRIIIIPDNDKIGKNIKKFRKYKRLSIYYSGLSKDYGDYWETEDRWYLEEIKIFLKNEGIYIK